jgi:hypothetical protein
VKTAVHILNRSPTRSLKGITPYEAWRKKKPAVDYFRTFGCVGHMKLVGPGISKLSDRALPVVFLGYETGSKAYRVLDPVKHRLYITRDVVFEEDRKWNWENKGDEIFADRFTVVYSEDMTTVTVQDSHNRTSSPVVPSAYPGSHQSETSPAAASSATTEGIRERAVPVLVPQQPSHTMVTRAQQGIFKPNPKYAEDL